MGKEKPKDAISPSRFVTDYEIEGWGGAIFFPPKTKKKAKRKKTKKKNKNK